MAKLGRAAKVGEASPHILIDGARMYAAAADAVNETYPNAFHVLSHLLGMSTELTLKAYLSEMGVATSRLRRYGHHLYKLYQRAVQLGLRDTSDRDMQMWVLERNYRLRRFAYPSPGIYYGIAMPQIRTVLHGMLAEAFVAINGHKVLEDLSDAPGLSIQSLYLEEITPARWAFRR